MPENWQKHLAEKCLRVMAQNKIKRTVKKKTSSSKLTKVSANHVKIIFIVTTSGEPRRRKTQFDAFKLQGEFREKSFSQVKMK